jgi:hypothetical protein
VFNDAQDDQAAPPTDAHEGYLADAFAAEPLFITRRFALRVNAYWSRLTGRPEGIGSTLVVIGLVALAPLALDLLLRLANAGSSWRGLGWIAAEGLLTGALLVSAAWGWPHVQTLAEPLELMFRGSRAASERIAPEPPPELAAYGNRMHNQLRVVRWHYAICLGTAAAAVASTYVASRQLPSDTVGPVYFMMIFVLAVLGTDSIRWMVRVPLIVVQPLTRVARLKVVMHAPVTTPAIRQMGAVAAMTAARCGIGLFLVGLPLLWTVLSAKSGGTPTSHAEKLALWGLLPLTVSAGVVVYVTFVPQLWLSQIVERQRDRILDELARDLPEEGPANLLSDNTARVMALYDRLAETSTETTAARVIVRRMLAVLAVLLPQLLAVGVKLLKLG